jgi:hypothetical protein
MAVDQTWDETPPAQFDLFCPRSRKWTDFAVSSYRGDPAVLDRNRLTLGLGTIERRNFAVEKNDVRFGPHHSPYNP